MKLCFSCKKALDIDGTPGRQDTCSYCGSDLKVCLNCIFYDEVSYNQCKEPMAERVVEKDKSNFCGYFKLKDSAKSEKQDKKEDTRKSLEELFKR